MGIPQKYYCLRVRLALKRFSSLYRRQVNVVAKKKYLLDKKKSQYVRVRVSK